MPTGFDLTSGIMYLLALVSLFGGILLGGLRGGLIALSPATSGSIARGCLGAFTGFLCHGMAGLIGLLSAIALGNNHERCVENCDDYHVSVLLAILATVHIIALAITIAIIRVKLRNIVN